MKSRCETFRLKLVSYALFFSFLLCATALTARNHDKEPVVRVKIGYSHQKIEIKSDNALVTDEKNHRIATIRKNRNFSWVVDKGRNRTRFNKQILTFSSPNDILTLNNKKYRGKFKIKFSSKGATVVNHVGIEDYLRGVVGSEMSSLSPAESLKAQAVIARTYAYANKGKHGSDGADVCDSTHCQVYQGISSERETINKAIAATCGVIMVSNGKPVETLYHAACGGMTSDNDKVFGGSPRSYLRRVICTFCYDSPHFRWRKTLNTKDLKKGLAKEKISFNRLFKVSYEADSPLDRVKNITFVTDCGNFSVKGTTFRRLFSLKSSTFTLGNRESIKELISSISKSHQPEADNNLKGIMIAGISDIADDGPPQLIIQTRRGLKRTIRPKEGWKTIYYGKQKNIAKKTDTPSQPSQIAASLEKLEIFGRGFGHQVGLCQAGAIEMGKRNWSYRQILPFYYSDVALRKLEY